MATEPRRRARPKMPSAPVLGIEEVELMEALELVEVLELADAPESVAEVLFESSTTSEDGATSVVASPETGESFSSSAEAELFVMSWSPETATSSPSSFMT